MSLPTLPPRAALALALGMFGLLTVGSPQCSAALEVASGRVSLAVQSDTVRFRTLALSGSERKNGTGGLDLLFTIGIGRGQ